MKKPALLIAPMAFVLVFFVLPVGNTFARFLRASELLDVLGSRSMLAVMWFSTWQAVVSTLATLAIGIPATWALSRFRFRGARIAHGILTAPFLLPSVVVAAGVLAINDSRGVLPIIWAHVIFNVAVVLRVVGPRWALLDERVENAASTLGAPPLQVFFRVVWPQISRATVSASALIFVYCFSSFGVIAILGGVSRRTMESEIFIQAVRLGDTRTATALAAVQAVIVGSVLLLTHRIAGPATLALHIRTPKALSTKPRNRFIVMFFASASCAMVAAPMIATIQRSFYAGGDFSTTAWRSIFSGNLPSLAISTHRVIGTSLAFALIAAIVCVPLALLAATALSTKQSLLGIVTSLPLAISAATVGIGLIITFDSDPIAWRSQQWLIPIIHALIALPLAIRVLEPAISSVPHPLRHASATLGASPFRTWRRVELPIIRPALLRASGLAMATSLGEFGATSFLSRTDSTTLPLAIAQMLGRPGIAVQQAGFALASLMIIITVGIMSRA